MTGQVAPVVRAVDVDATVERAFAVFTERIGDWWPLATHGIYGDRARTCVLEPRQGGRLFERSVDGEEAHWATVTVFEPPERLVLSWQPNPDRPAPTEVEVTFTSIGGSTHVELVHRGWELLGDEGAEARTSYDEGWPETLRLYSEAVEAS
jgi:uncharacterized protein YndB with AHSA1/START domain